MTNKKGPDMSNLVAITHEALIAEMPKLDRMNQAERLKHNRRRREKQIKKWKELEEKIFKKNLGSGTKKSSASLPVNAASNSNRNIDFINQSKLFDFVSKRNLKDLKAYLDKMSEEDQVTLISSVNHHGMTALHKCVAEGASKIAEQLISRGADINVGDKDQWTPLHAAAFIGDLDLVDLFVASKADLTRLNLDLQTCLDLTESAEVKEFLKEQFERHELTDEVIQELKDRPSLSMLTEAENLPLEELNEHRFDNGATLLHIAASNGFTQAVETLIKKGVKLEEVDEDGWTPLHAAVYWGHESTIAKLVLADANFHAETLAGDDVLSLAPNENLKERIENMFTDYTKDKAKQFFESIDIAGTIRGRDGRSSSVMAKSMLKPEKFSEDNITTGMMMGANLGLITDKNEDDETFEVYFRTSVDISDPYLHRVYGESYVAKKVGLSSDSLTGSIFSIKQSSRDSIFTSKTTSTTPMDEDVLPLGSIKETSEEASRKASAEQTEQTVQNENGPDIVVTPEASSKSVPIDFTGNHADEKSDSDIVKLPSKPEGSDTDSPLFKRNMLDMKTQSVEVSRAGGTDVRTMSDFGPKGKRGKAQTTMEGKQKEKHEEKSKPIEKRMSRSRKSNVVCTIC